MCITIGTCVEASDACCEDCAADVGARPIGPCVSDAGPAPQLYSCMSLLPAGRRFAFAWPAAVRVRRLPPRGRCSRRPPTSSPRCPRVRRTCTLYCECRNLCVCACACVARRMHTHAELLDAVTCFWTYVLAFGHKRSLLDTSAR